MNTAVISQAIKYLSIFAATLAPLLLVAGYSFHIGYLGAFGVDVMLLPMDMADNFGTAWYMGVSLIAKLASNIWWLLLIPVLFMAAIFSVVLVLLPFRHKPFLRWVLGELDEENPGRTIFGMESFRWRRVLGDMFHMSEQGFTAILLVFLVVLALPMLVVIVPANLGGELGQEQRKAIETVDFDCSAAMPKKLKCIDLNRDLDKEHYQGLFITGTARFIALYEKAGVVILERQTKDKVRIRSLSPAVVAVKSP